MRTSESKEKKKKKKMMMMMKRRYHKWQKMRWKRFVSEIRRGGKVF